MTEHSLAIIGVALAVCGVPVLLLRYVSARRGGKRGRATTWQGGVTLFGVVSTVCAVAIGFGIGQWDDAHVGPPASPTYSNPLQGPPDGGCPSGPLSC